MGWWRCAICGRTRTTDEPVLGALAEHMAVWHPKGGHDGH